MSDMANLGKILILFGVLIVAFGAMLYFMAGRFPNIGRLPGDIIIQRPGLTCWIPLMTSLILSVLLSLILWAINAFLRR